MSIFKNPILLVLIIVVLMGLAGLVIILKMVLKREAGPEEETPVPDPVRRRPDTPPKAAVPLRPEMPKRPGPVPPPAAAGTMLRPAVPLRRPEGALPGHESLDKVRVLAEENKTMSLILTDKIEELSRKMDTLGKPAAPSKVDLTGEFKKLEQGVLAELKNQLQEVSAFSEFNLETKDSLRRLNQQVDSLRAKVESQQDKLESFTHLFEQIDVYLAQANKYFKSHEPDK